MYKHLMGCNSEFWCKTLQLCVWSIDGWEKKKSRYIQPTANRPGTLVGDTRVQFHNDQQHLLVVHESQLAIYDGNLECLRSVSPLTFINSFVIFIRGGPVHVAPACAGPGEGSDHIGSYVLSLFLHFFKRLFPRLEPMTSWLQGNDFTTVLGLPLSFVIFIW
jgi:hypothetical protein